MPIFESSRPPKSDAHWDLEPRRIGNTGARLCLKGQSQRVPITLGVEMDTDPVRTRCGWSFGHSRAPVHGKTSRARREQELLATRSIDAKGPWSLPKPHPTPRCCTQLERKESRAT